MIKTNKRKIILLIVLLFSLATIISSSYAADITINSTENFKSTIENADTNSVIELNTSYGEFSLNSSNVNINIKKNITIQSSNSSQNAIINLNKNGRAFNVTSEGVLTLINITIINGINGTSTVPGDYSSYCGGAIYNEGIVNLTACIFINNNVAGNGGAIYSSKNIVLTDCVFINNSNAIFSSGDGVLSNCIFNTNTEGTIYNCGNITLIGCNFTSNSDAFSNSFGNATLTNCIFISNIAEEMGGAIHNYVGILTINNCSFTANTADMGGVIYNLGGMYSTILTINNCTFTSNTAKEGGVIYNTNGATVTVISSNFTNNKANYGAVIYNYGATYNLQGNTMINNIGGDIANLTFIDLAISTVVSSNKITITAKVTNGDNGKAIAGKLVYFYVNGKLVGNGTSNSAGIATFIYSTTKSGTHKIDAKITESANFVSGITQVSTSANANKNAVLKVATIKLYKATTSKAIKKKGKKLYKKTYKYKNSGHITGTKKFTIKLGSKYKLSGKVTKSTNVSYKYNKKTNKITVTVKNLAYNKIVQLKFKTIKI